MTDETLKTLLTFDEIPLGKNSIDEGSQYQDSGLRVSGEIISVALLFRVVNTKNMYDYKDDTMVVHPESHKSNIIHYCLGRDMDMYHNKLLELYHHVLY